jgi:hypothetical protein
MDSTQADYQIDLNPKMPYFSNHAVLGNMTLRELGTAELETASNMQKVAVDITPKQVSQQSLDLTFVNVDTEELRDVNINFKGDKSIFKVGEGEGCHF